MEIKPGDLLTVRTATGKSLSRRAVTGVQPGSSFPVVWVCTDEEWNRALAEGREPQSIPWPVDAVESKTEQMPLNGSNPIPGRMPNSKAGAI